MPSNPRSKGIAIALSCLLVPAVAAAGLWWHLREPSFAVSCRVVEGKEHILVHVDVTNTGHAIHYEAIEADLQYCFGRGKLIDHQDTVYLNTNTGGLLPTVMPSKAWFRHLQTTTYIYNFPKDLPSDTYSLQFFFLGETLELPNAVTILQTHAPENPEPPMVSESIPQLSATYTIMKVADKLDILVTVTNTGAPLPYHGALEDQFSHAQLLVGEEACCTSTNPLVSTDDATERSFDTKETATYIYSFPKNVSDNLYDLSFRFAGVPLRLYGLPIYEPPELSAAYEILEINGMQRIRVTVTNHGHPVPYIGAIEDQFTNALLMVDGETIYISTNPKVNTDNATRQSFQTGETAIYDYAFDRKLSGKTYDMVFHFLQQEIYISIVL